MSPKLCPVCEKPLSLQQINLDQAVYFCMDLKCQYPVGNHCIMIQRNYRDMENDEDCSDWVSDLTQSTVTTEWIENLLEEAVNQVKNEQVTSDDKTNFDEILSFFDT